MQRDQRQGCENRAENKFNNVDLCLGIFFLSLEAARPTEAGAAPAASGMLKTDNNKLVFSVATGLVGCKFAILPQHCFPSS